MGLGVNVALVAATDGVGNDDRVVVEIAPAAV